MPTLSRGERLLRRPRLMGLSRVELVLRRVCLSVRLSYAGFVCGEPVLRRVCLPMSLSSAGSVSQRMMSSNEFCLMNMSSPVLSTLAAL